MNNGSYSELSKVENTSLVLVPILFILFVNYIKFRFKSIFLYQGKRQNEIQSLQDVSGLLKLVQGGHNGCLQLPLRFIGLLVHPCIFKEDLASSRNSPNLSIAIYAPTWRLTKSQDRTIQCLGESMWLSHIFANVGK